MTGVASCLFAVSHAPGAPTAQTLARAHALARFYRPLGAREALCATPFEGLVVGEVEFDALDGGRGCGGRPPAAGRGWLACWGGPFRDEVTGGPRAAIEASDTALRRIRGIGLLAASEGDRAVLVTSPVGPTALYSAECDGVAVYATHAVAAAWLCHGAVALAAEALPEFLVTGFVGGDRTHLEGVRAVGAAQRIDIRPGSVARRGYWPLAHRWQPHVEEREAFSEAERALAEALDTRLGGCKQPLCALTAGKDSRVVALAMRDLIGTDFSAMTWGEEHSGEVAGAREVAAALSIPHRRYGYRMHDDHATRAAVERAVRWSDGLDPTAGLGMPDVPQHPSAIVTGRGGETARAFFYRLGARHHPRPVHEQLAETFLEHRPARLVGADPHAELLVRESVGRWIDAARESGHQGWRLLDVVYAEERLRRWDRTCLMRQRSLYVPAFDDLAVQRALVALPLEDRLTDGFHRRFIAARAPSLTPAPPRGQRRGVPAVLRRAVRQVRGRYGAPRAPAPQPWGLAAEWKSRPNTHSWFADEILAAPVLEEAFGPGYVAQTRAGFLAGEAAATQALLLLAAPIALALVAKRELRDDGSGGWRDHACGPRP